MLGPAALRIGSLGKALVLDYRLRPGGRFTARRGLVRPSVCALQVKGARRGVCFRGRRIGVVNCCSRAGPRRDSLSFGNVSSFLALRRCLPTSGSPSATAISLPTGTRLSPGVMSTLTCLTGMGSCCSGGGLLSVVSSSRQGSLSTH